jgi:hypothetical protein
MDEVTTEEQDHIDRIVDCIDLNEQKYTELLRLIGKMSVRFNILEQNFKYCLILLRKDQPLRVAQKKVLAITNVKTLFKKVCYHFIAKTSDQALREEFKKIFDEANAIRIERNLMLHSIWLWTVNAEKPFLRMKEDEADAEIDFDVPTVQRIIERAEACSSQAYKFFCNNVVGYREIESKLFYSPKVYPTSVNDV